MNKNKKKTSVTESAIEKKLKGFLDIIAPSRVCEEISVNV